MELELLQLDEQQNEYIKVPIGLEQSILEGSYKIVMKNEIQDTNYNYYLKKFDSAIRFQIARSAERSYDSLKLNDAISLLKLNNSDQLVSYIKNEVETIEVFI